MGATIAARAVLGFSPFPLSPPQGLKKEEGKAQFGEQYRMWQKHASDFTIEGHFPVRELWERASACWQIILSHPGDSILVVAHNAVNQALVATATGRSTSPASTFIPSSGNQRTSLVRE